MCMSMSNSAPEKIYVHIKYKPCEITFSEVIEKECSNIEYIRKDAFIKTAEKYLKTQFIKDVSVLAGGAVNINFSAAIENFVKYMKGE